LAGASKAAENTPLYSLILDTAADLIAAKTKVREHVNMVRMRLDSLEYKLAEIRPSLNDLGELQSSAPALDLCVAQLVCKQRKLDALMRLAERLSR
jgi:hypothetical protein